MLKNPAPKSSSPALMRTSASMAPSSNITTPTSSSLASILGQPRMATAPHPRFAGRSMAPPHIPRNSSPLMALRPGPPVSSIGGPGVGPGPMGMPSLHPRPPAGILGGPPQVPPVAGPVSEQLNKVAGKLVDFMRGTLEELFKELSAQVRDLFLTASSYRVGNQFM